MSDGTVYWYDDGSRLIVQWDNVAHYSAGGPYSFQAILNADGSIVFQYNSMADPDQQRHPGHPGRHRQRRPAGGLQHAVRGRRPGRPDLGHPPVADRDPDLGHDLRAGDSTTLDVAFDASGLVGGTYDGFIRIVSNDPDEPDYQVPVQLDVTGAPDIEVSPPVFDFGPCSWGRRPDRRTIVVRNAGTDL